MLKKFVLVFMILLCGCSINKRYIYADYNHVMYNDATFYSQYEIIYKTNINKKEQVVVAPFLADSNNYLPVNIQKLHLGLKIVNPLREKLDIWVNYKFIGVDTDKVLLKQRFVYRSQTLPEEFISINMPYATNIHSKVEFFVEVAFESGQILFKTSKASYRVRGEQDLDD